jgi:putative Holliday junction resolvase
VTRARRAHNTKDEREATAEEPAMPPPGGRVPNAREGRVMALDLGEAHVGVAISDPTRTIAQPLAAVAARPWAGFIARLHQLIEQYEPVACVVGLAIREDGSVGAEAARQQEVAGRLEACLGLPVIVYDERYTTKMARSIHRELGVKGPKARTRVHSLAASHLLSDFLRGGPSLTR